MGPYMSAAATQEVVIALLNASGKKVPGSTELASLLDEDLLACPASAFR
jgi:hypothetical protein